MSFEGLQERLTALQETTAQLKELIDRLANLKFQPGSVPLGTDEDSGVSGELSFEINQILREEDDELELLQEEVEDLRSGRPESEAEHHKKRLKDGVERLKQELKRSRVTFRKAQLAAKRNLSQAQRLERELLVQSYSQPGSEATSPVFGADKSPALPQIVRHRQAQQQQSSLSEEDQQTVGASGNVTSALRRTHDMIATELARSEYAHQTLTESTAALAQLNESYSSLDTMLASSKDLLGTLLRSQKSDTWYLQTALYMLFVTGAWLVYRRFLYGPLWWLVWLPLKLLYSLTVGGGSAVVKYAGSGKPSEAVVHEGKVDVEGLPNEDLPTVEVAHEAKSSEAAGDPDSMIETVGKIVDGVEGEEVQADDSIIGDEQPALKETPGVGSNNMNAKARMMEEQKKGAEGEIRQKYEL